MGTRSSRHVIGSGSNAVGLHDEINLIIAIVG